MGKPAPCYSYPYKTRGKVTTDCADPVNLRSRSHTGKATARCCIIRRTGRHVTSPMDWKIPNSIARPIAPSTA